MSSDTQENPDNCLLTIKSLQDAFIGVAESYGRVPVACYSKKKTIDIIQKKNQTSKKEAYSIYEYKYLLKDLGEASPVFLDDENKYDV
tara:strand:+ start:6743 stop:7006 length:264 start_codon:yes stop_codon:yes gene_type:complete